MHKPKIVFGMKVKARLHQKEVKRTFSQSFNLSPTASLLQSLTIKLHDFDAAAHVRSNHLAASRRKVYVEVVALKKALARRRSVVRVPVETTFKTIGRARRGFDKYQGECPLALERVLSEPLARVALLGIVSGLQGI